MTQAGLQLPAEEKTEMHSDLSKHHPSAVLALKSPLLTEVKYIPNKI